MEAPDFNAIVLCGHHKYLDLAKKKIESYDKLITHLPPTVETEFRITKVVQCKQNKQNIKSIKFTIYHENANLQQSYIFKDGNKVPLYPSDAAISNKTYDIQLYSDVILEMIQYRENANGSIEELPPVVQRLNNVLVSPLPCMVGSKKCHLYGKTAAMKIALGEDPNDMGGRYIIDGSDKCIVAYKNVAKNIPQIHKLKKHAENISVKLDFTSKPGDNYERSTYVVMCITTGKLLYVKLTLGKDLSLILPFFVIYYIYDMTSDKDIFETILPNKTDSIRDTNIASMIRYALVENYTNPNGKIKKDIVKKYRFADYYHKTGNKITDVTAILMLIARVINENEGGATAERYDVDTARDEVKKLIINKIIGRIDNSLFPHIGTTSEYRRSKLYFIGKLIHSMMSVELGDEPTDRNSFFNLVCTNDGPGIIGAFKSVYNINNMNPLMKAVEHNLRGDPDINFEKIFNSVIQPAKMGANLDKTLKAGSKENITINKKTNIKNRLFTVQYERVNAASEYHALNGITPDPNGIGGKAGESNLAARGVHPTQSGIVCGIQSVEGERAGQSGQLTLIVRFTDIIATNPLKELLRKDVQPPSMMSRDNYGLVYVNYDLIGSHHNTFELAEKYTKLRRQGIIDRWVTIDYKPLDGGNLYFYTMQGRPIRPFIIVYNNHDAWIEGKEPFKQWITYTDQHAKDLYDGKITLSDLEVQGVIEYITPMEYRRIFACDSYETFVTKMNNELYPFTHLDIPLGNFCLTALTCPYGNNSDIVRTLYQTKLSKQAMVYTPTGNYHNAYYAKMPIAFNLYKPLVVTVANKLINIGCGNLFVAIIADSDNQEDSLTAREGFSQSMMMSAILTNPISVELENGQALGTPDPATVEKLKCKSYSHLIKGIPKPGTIIEKDMPLLGILRIDPATKKMVDESLVHKKDKPVIIDTVSQGNNSKAAVVIKIKTYVIRHVEPGDKFASMQGNKGIISCVKNDEESLITEDGIRPHICVSSFAFPSRMTADQLFAGRNSDLCSVLGVFMDGSIFSNPENPKIKQMAEERGMNYLGVKTAYHGVTGRRINTGIFCVPQTYQRLTKMAADTSNVVDNPSIDIKTDQPNKGVGTGGGIRFGEMEKDTGLANGSMNFLQYKMIDKCDGKKIVVCNSCGLPAIFNFDSGIYICKNCDYTTFSTVSTTRSTLTYSQYLRTLGVGTRFKLDTPKFISEQ